ncbi:ankyrin repeat-containing domain protein [Cercophora scortea]|uniref:Ankyrin repeat-containing domain protein n=1 Tax=Cercophora scortea TaxID=314031 RepID=A0AAE0MC17_9PEZI|nr:ankyrin repeat-containing domain protein [Cercophora scortea]
MAAGRNAPPSYFTGIMPIETLLIVGDILSAEADIASLAALARTCRRMKAIFEPILYRYDADDNHPLAMFWGASHGLIPTMEKSLAQGFSPNARKALLEDEPGPLRVEVTDQAGVRVETVRHVPEAQTGSPIHVAVMNGHDNAVAWLLDHGADIDANYTCRCHYKGHLYIMGFNNLRDLEPPGVEMPPTNGPRAVRGRYCGTYPTSYCGLPLHLALSHGHKSTASLLLDHGAPLYAVDPASGGRRPTLALHTAATHGHHELLERLLQQPGADINAMNCDSYTPVNLAAANDEVETVLRLRELGANLGTSRSHVTPNQNMTTLDVALDTGAWKTATALLDLHYSSNAPDGYRGLLSRVFRADFIAKSLPAEGTIERLKDAGPRVLSEKAEWREGRLAVIRRLAAICPDLDNQLRGPLDSLPHCGFPPHESLYSPLWYACYDKANSDARGELLSLLVELGVDVNQQDKLTRCTMLHLLIRSVPPCRIDLWTVTFLVNHGARVNIPDQKEGKTVLDLVHELTGSTLIGEKLQAVKLLRLFIQHAEQVCLSKTEVYVAGDAIEAMFAELREGIALPTSRSAPRTWIFTERDGEATP